MVELGKFKSKVVLARQVCIETTTLRISPEAWAGSGDPNFARHTTLERLVEVKID